MQTADCRLGIKCRLSIKLCAYQEITWIWTLPPLSLLAGINKRAPRRYWSVGVGEVLFAILSRNLEAHKCQSPGGDASPEVPRRIQRHSSEHVMKFRLVIVWCLVLCIYKIIWCRRSALKLSSPQKQGSEIYHTPGVLPKARIPELKAGMVKTQNHQNIKASDR